MRAIATTKPKLGGHPRRQARLQGRSRNNQVFGMHVFARRISALLVLAWLSGMTGCQGVGGTTLWGGAQPEQPPHQSSVPIGQGPRGKVDPDKASAGLLFFSGQELEQKGRLEDALHNYQAAAKRAPDRADIQLRLAIIQDKLGQFERSDEYYKKALKLDPGNPQIFCARGYSKYLQGQWAEAEQSLRQAIALRSNYRAAHNNLGLLLARRRRVDEALMAFHRGGLTEAEAHANVGWGRMLDKDFNQAREHYLLALRDNPQLEKAKRGMKNLEFAVAHLGDQPGYAAPGLPGSGMASGGNSLSEPPAQLASTRKPVASSAQAPHPAADLAAHGLAPPEPVAEDQDLVTNEVEMGPNHRQLNISTPEVFTEAEGQQPQQARRVSQPAEFESVTQVDAEEEAGAEEFAPEEFGTEEFAPGEFGTEEFATEDFATEESGTGEPLPEAMSIEEFGVQDAKEQPGVGPSTEEFQPIQGSPSARPVRRRGWDKKVKLIPFVPTEQSSDSERVVSTAAEDVPEIEQQQVPAEVITEDSISEPRGLWGAFRTRP